MEGNRSNERSTRHRPAVSRDKRGPSSICLIMAGTVLWCALHCVLLRASPQHSQVPCRNLRRERRKSSQDVYAETSPRLLPKLLLVMVLHHSNRNPNKDEYESQNRDTKGSLDSDFLFP